MTPQATGGARGRGLLVIGPRGLIGRGVVAEAERRGLGLHAWGRKTLNLRTPGAWPALPAGVATVVLCAGLSNMDEAERAPGLARAVNAVAAGRLAERCADAGARLVFVSSPEVFRGDDPDPHLVDAPLDPVNAHGEAMAERERRVADAGGRWSCVRCGWVFASWGHHYVRSVRRQLSVRASVEAVTDRIGQPTAATGLAAFLLDLAAANAGGTFHHADAGTASRYDLACAVADHAGRAGDVVPVTGGRFARPAARMASAVLDLSATEARFGPRRPWRATLGEVLDELDRGDPVESATRKP